MGSGMMGGGYGPGMMGGGQGAGMMAVSYTHLRAHETVLDLVCRLLLEKKKHTVYRYDYHIIITKTKRR